MAEDSDLYRTVRDGAPQRYLRRYIIDLHPERPGFLNSLGIYYQNHGASMNYGVARGMGSLAFNKGVESNTYEMIDEMLNEELLLSQIAKISRWPLEKVEAYAKSIYHTPSR